MLYIFKQQKEKTMRKSIDLYFKFMWNKWSYEICKDIFEDLADHIWEKWLNIKDDYDYIAAPAILWSHLDYECQEAICNYIITIGYKG